MIYKMYSVCDLKTSFAAPYMDVNDDSAVRGFRFAFDNNTNIMVFSPADFRLYRIGEFDSSNGSITPELVPVLVFDGASMARKDVSNEE